MLKTKFPGKKYKHPGVFDFMFISNHTIPPLIPFALPANDSGSISDFFPSPINEDIFSILIQPSVDGHPDVEVTEKQAVVWSSDGVLGSIGGRCGHITDLR